MVFAVDIDGVLIDLKEFIYEEGKKFLKKRNRKPRWIRRRIHIRRFYRRTPKILESQILGLHTS